MRKFVWGSLILPLIILLGCTKEQNDMADLVFNPRLIVLAGQSNAAGIGEGAELPSDLSGPIAGAKIFYGDPPTATKWSGFSWQTLQYNVNHGGTQGDAALYRGAFGVELRLMKLLVDKFGADFNLLKVALGGTPLKQVSDGIDWSPASTNELYFKSNAYELAGMAALPNHLPPAAYIWIQGEQDAYLNNTNYRNNLIEFINSKREVLGNPAMPFIICRLGNLQTQLGTEYRNMIRADQEYVAANVPNCYLVDFDGLATKPDNIHYTAASYDSAARRIFTLLRTLIPIRVAKFFVAKNNIALAVAGFNADNTSVLVDAHFKSFNPNRLTNGLTHLEANHGYYGFISETLDLRDHIYTA